MPGRSGLGERELAQDDADPQGLHQLEAGQSSQVLRVPFLQLSDLGANVVRCAPNDAHSPNTEIVLCRSEPSCSSFW